jgi:hypothetical protein
MRLRLKDPLGPAFDVVVRRLADMGYAVAADEEYRAAFYDGRLWIEFKGERYYGGFQATLTDNSGRTVVISGVAELLCPERWKDALERQRERRRSDGHLAAEIQFMSEIVELIDALGPQLDLAEPEFQRRYIANDQELLRRDGADELAAIVPRMFELPRALPRGHPLRAPQ